MPLHSNYNHYRQRDFTEDTDELLEDKLFIMFVVDSRSREPRNWPYANAEWMTPDNYKAQQKRFDSCIDMLELIKQDQPQFKDNRTPYSADNY